MELIRHSNGQKINLTSPSVIGKGGEARIVRWPHDSQLVAKLYHTPSETHANKLAAMVRNPPNATSSSGSHTRIAWPVDLLHHAKPGGGIGHLAGFLMPLVVNHQPVINYYNPAKRRLHCPLFDYSYLHRTARNLAAAVSAVHDRGYVIGDVNESNILVSETALVTLVDTDSFQVTATQPGTGKTIVHRCPVGKPEYTPPELQGKSFSSIDRNVQHDLFGLAVLVFQLLMEGFHPFAGGSGSGEASLIGESILRGGFSHGRHPKQKPPPGAPPFRILNPRLQEMFTRCFEEGHGKPSVRPTALQWQSALIDAEKRL